MIRQAVDARFAFSGDVGPGFRRGEIYGCARRGKKRMAKIIVVKQSMDIAAQHAARGAHGPVRNGAGNSLAYNIREWTGSRFIKSLADMDFIALETGFRSEAKTKKL